MKDTYVEVVEEGGIDAGMPFDIENIHSYTVLQKNLGKDANFSS